MELTAIQMEAIGTGAIFLIVFAVQIYQKVRS